MTTLEPTDSHSCLLLLGVEAGTMGLSSEQEVGPPLEDGVEDRSREISIV